MEFSQVWAYAIAACGWIVVIINAIEKIALARKAINAPNEEQDRRLAALEARCEKYDRYFNSDKQRLSDLEQALSVLMQGTFALISHAVNGNDVDKLKKTQEEMMDYLTKRGIKI